MSELISFVLISIGGAIVTSLLIATLAKVLIPIVRVRLYGSKKSPQALNASAAHVR